jgi:hypothetical protein
MSADAYDELLTGFGLTGWKAAVKYRDGWVAILTPPGFARDGSTNGMVTRRGTDEADAVTNAIHAVRGSLQ